MSIITKNHKVGLFAIFIATALMLGTISVSGFDTALATNSNSQKLDNSDKSDRHSDNKDGKKKSNNDAEQEIEQAQVSEQSSSCRDSGAVVVSALNCNNIALQLNANLGSNSLGQE